MSYDYHTGMIPRWKAVIFDRDGTLFDSLPVILRAFNYGIEPFTDKRPTDAEWFAAFGPAEPEVLAVFIPERNKAEAFGRFYNYYKEHFHEISLFPGVKALLERLRDAGVKMAIFTGGGAKSTVFCLQKEKILSFFGELVTGDRVSHPKPDPEGVHLAIQSLGVRPEQALVVGDAGADVIAAQKAGAAGGLARWSGLVPPHDLECRPDFEFRTLKELETAVFGDEDTDEHG